MREAQVGASELQPRSADLAELNDSAEALAVLKKSGPVGILFLLAYIAIDSRSARVGMPVAVSPYHWLALLTLLLFFALTWRPAFRAHWRLWSFLCAVTMIALIIRISAITGDTDTRYVAFILCPFATAAFIVWGWRWQLALTIAILVLYGVAQLTVPLGLGFQPHRLIGLLAGLTLAQFTAVFLDGYRRNLRLQVTRLADAAVFRETQIATMTHDIRNPLATLSGLVSLLDDDDLDERQRTDLLARVRSTTTAMDLLVKNLLDLYLIEEQRLRPNARLIDVNRIVADTVEHYSMEARLKSLELKLDLANLPRMTLDPLHLERILANLVVAAVRRCAGGAISITTAPSDTGVMIAIADSNPTPTPAEISQIFARPSVTGDGARSAALGRYIAHAIVKTDGGRIDASANAAGGLTLMVRLPGSAPAATTDAGPSAEPPVPGSSAGSLGGSR